ncbi:hypothetical protein D9619_011879 [Psilocybe cf. subviscida]|uniref:N-acetyltransferase domain-containing protein n=1 Tax=Psilocybe cf. subviscida TaxID=2480587 RepID=A0A8H5B183_9AGAR|nr:hypothetical protein D9619_011879 [Psilocybe cf. subviscida]
MVGGRDELRPLLFSAMIRAGALDGQLYVLEVIEQIVSIALWFKPGHMLWSSEEQRNLGYNKLMEQLSEEDRNWWTNTYTAQVGDFLKKTLEVPFEEIWWLSLLGTDPAYQRHGYATRLMDFVLTKMNSPGHAASTLIQEKFYNGVGYPTKGFFTLPNRLNPVPVYSFLRKI